MNGTKHFCPDERDMPFVPDFVEVLGVRAGSGRDGHVYVLSRSRIPLPIPTPTPEMSVPTGM